MEDRSAPKPPAVRTTPEAGSAEWRTSRRRLLKTGLFGSIALAGAGLIVRGGGAAAQSPVCASAYEFFRTRDVPLAHAVTNSFLDGVLPADAAARGRAVEQAVLVADAYFAAFSSAVQAEALQAFDLLDLWLVRRFIAGVSEPWESATVGAMNAFLESFRVSRLDTFRQIFRLLEGMATVGWYGQPAAWPALGYPGAPVLPRPRGDAPL